MEQSEIIAKLTTIEQKLDILLQKWELLFPPKPPMTPSTYWDKLGIAFTADYPLKKLDLDVKRE